MSDCFEDKETPAPTSSPPESEAAAPPKPKKKPCPCSKTACLHVPASEEVNATSFKQDLILND